MKNIIPDSLAQSKRIALMDCKGASKTYEELFAEAGCWGELIEERSVVCILCDRELETVSFLLEMFLIGAVPMLLPPDMDEVFLDGLLEAYQVPCLWCESVRAAEGDVMKDAEHHVLRRLRYQKPEIHPDLAMLLSTSGSTGTSKMVRLSYENLIYNIEAAVDRYGILPEHKTITALPLHHVWGLQFCMWHWYVGAGVLVTDDSVMTGQFMDFYMRERVNNIAGSPYTYRMMRKIRFWDKERLDMLHSAMCAGAMLPKDEQDYFAHLMGDKFWSQYGQTESTGALLGCDFGLQDCGEGIIGLPLAGTGAYLDADEIILTGKGVSMGYAYGYRDLPKGDENRGILHTGDTGMTDSEGYFYITGRKSRFVKILGERISLDEIEKLLERQAGEAGEAGFACIGGTDRLEVFHTGQAEKGSEDENWIRLLNGRLRIPAYMVHIHKVARIPRSESGKILYEKLGNGSGRNLYEE